MMRITLWLLFLISLALGMAVLLFGFSKLSSILEHQHNSFYIERPDIGPFFHFMPFHFLPGIALMLGAFLTSRQLAVFGNAGPRWSVGVLHRLLQVVTFLVCALAASEICLLTMLSAAQLHDLSHSRLFKWLHHGAMWTISIVAIAYAIAVLLELTKIMLAKRKAGGA